MTRRVRGQAILGCWSKKLAPSRGLCTCTCQVLPPSVVLPRSGPLFHHLIQTTTPPHQHRSSCKLLTKSRRPHGVAGRNSGFAWLWTVLPRQGTSQEPCPPVRTPVCLPGGAEEQTVPPGGGRFCSVVPESADSMWSWCGAPRGASLGLGAVREDRQGASCVLAKHFWIRQLCAAANACGGAAPVERFNQPVRQSVVQAGQQG